CLLVSMHDIQANDIKSCFVFVGDLNVHHQNWLVSVSRTNSAGEAAYDFSNLSGCNQLIDVATHISGNCLDLLLTDVPAVVQHLVKPPLGTSDHCQVTFNLKLAFAVPDVRFSRKVYLKSRANWDSIVDGVASIRWTDIYRSSDSVALLNSRFTEIIDRLVPHKILHTRIRDKAWFNVHCRRAHDDKQRAYRQWSRDRSRANWDFYTQLRCHAAEVYANAQEEYFNHLRMTLGNTRQPHKWWSTLKSSLFGMDSSLPPLRGTDGDLEFDPRRKAQILSSAFVSKQSNWSPCLPATCHPEPKVTALAFRSSDVYKYLIDLDAHGGIDSNGIFPLFLKKLAKPLAPKLTKLFRVLLSSGSFPHVWRSANIIPIPKGNSCSQYPMDYRPISITPVLSKIYEKLLSRKLSRFVEVSNLLPNTQFGFRTGLGTTDALLTLVHDLQSGLDSRSEARVLSLDFSSAFDLVSHRALLYKIESIGVGGKVLDVLSEFLADRRQCVSVDGQLSESVPVVSGVPQGSVLGPLLFILYTADMWRDIENKLVSYADDTTLYSLINSPRDRVMVADSLNRDLHRISGWCERWGMKLNPSKTQSIIVSRSRTVNPPHPLLTVCGQSIPVCSSLRLLGVTVDNKLTFECHIRKLVSSIAQRGGILRKCYKTFRDYDIVLKSFYAFVLPSFEYYSPVWMSAAPCHLRLLERTLNSLRFIVPNLEINLDKRREIAGLSLLFKIMRNENHPMYVRLPDPYVPGRSTRLSRSLNDFALKSIRFSTNQFSRCFLPHFCSSWSVLPNSVVDVNDGNTFKSALKRYINSDC
ncbi:MAG: reverse transcriptase family protein, partial [Cyanobacteria bacterium P01_G01_bin.49]